MWILGWCDHVEAFRAALKHSFTRYLFRLHTAKTKKGKCNLTCVACHKIKASGMILLKILDTLPISHALKFWQLWIPVFLLLHYQTLWLALPHVSHDLYPEPLSDLDSALLLIFNYFCNDKHFLLLLTTQDKSASSTDGVLQSSRAVHVSVPYDNATPETGPNSWHSVSIPS